MAAIAVALHFIVTRQPTSSAFPTVRFVPIDAVRVITVGRPRDGLVLLVRCLTAIVIGAALARPVLTPRRRTVARVVLADVSGAVRTAADVRDSVRPLLGPGDTLVPFDGHVSSALIVAQRLASAIRDKADSVELVIVSPLLSGEIDGATAGIRALWPGRMRVIHVAANLDTAARGEVVIEGGKDNPLAVAAQAAGPGRPILVRWPSADAPPGWIARRAVDTVGAVVAGEAAVVFPFERRWMLDPAMPPAHVIARWVDGQPAAIERQVAERCIRDVAIPVPSRGDLVLRPAFRRFLDQIFAPCGTSPGTAPLSDAEVGALAGAGRLAARRAIPVPDRIATPLVPWLLGVALLLAVLEILIR